MDFRLDKRALSVTTFAEQRRTNPDLAYWRGRPPAEQLAPDFDDFCALLIAHRVKSAGIARRNRQTNTISGIIRRRRETRCFASVDERAPSARGWPETRPETDRRTSARAR